MVRRSNITMEDVARAGRVSKQTVSAVINNKSGISEETRARIRAIIAKLDYTPNMLAGSLRGQRSFTIGVVIPSITNPFYPEIVRGIEDEAQPHGYSIFLCNSDENPEKELNYLHLLRRHRIAGLIAVTIMATPPWTEALEKLSVSGVPVVELLSGRHLGGKVDTVTVDDEEGFVKVTAHLLDLGHNRIGLIMPPAFPNEEQTPRVKGFFKAHTLRGKKVAPELLAQGGWHVLDGQSAASYLMQLARPPTAIAAANDMAAIGAIARLKELNRRVPEDVAVSGFDNIHIAEWYDPPITTVDQPRYQMGQRAMQALLNRIESPGKPAEIVRLETSLVVRQSSGAQRRSAFAG